MELVGEGFGKVKVKEGDDCSLGTTNPFTPKS